MTRFGQNKFQTNDAVWLTEPGSQQLKGPYLIASMPSPGNYTLSYENGQPAEGGKTFKERLLDFAE
ncbi:hypothetical protein K469DRAFT_708575 [Zopfia rhizophila CBS 207.26]|uniref:Uncharacterized protein n=1 Tax=Zopfia rhizophila CBS 207.26 TaxID=1314779 RepID=A0A6A6DYQ7_9PEZI|nr:hypothetical protein K469DRAFT_708575 [Zopfia rhizophila CBS 207.26]